MKNITIQIPKACVGRNFEFFINKRRYEIIQGNDVFFGEHDYDLSDYCGYDYSIFKNTILVTFFCENEIIKT